MIKAEDIALDPASNAMYISKKGTGFEPTVLFSAASTHDSHVFNQRGRYDVGCWGLVVL